MGRRSKGKKIWNMEIKNKKHLTNVNINDIIVIEKEKSMF
jgi:hypothetical protein